MTHPRFSLIGYILSEIGLGQAARNIAYSLESENLPINLVNIHLEGKSNSQEFISKCGPYQAGNINFVVCSLGDARGFYSAIREAGSGIKNYLYPFWELDRLPYSDLKDLNSYDEIIAPSSFIANAFTNFIGRDVKTIPLPVRIPQNIRPNVIKDGVLRIYSAIDFDSHVARKNPQGILDAFNAAFPGNYNDVRLILKVRGSNDFGARNLLQAYCARDSRIKVIDQTLSRIELDALADESNVYLSMHRSEGFGFGPAEAMASEKIVVATDYGGSRDFLNSSTGYPVDYKLTPVKPSDYPCWENQLWAEPTIDSAVYALRGIYDHYDMALERAKNGRKLMLDQHAFEVAGRALKQLL